MKVLDRFVGYYLLYSKLKEIRALQKEFDMINLENEFFLVRFRSKEDYTKVLEEGPQRFQGNYVTINKWKPDLRPAKADIKTTLV